MPSLRLSGKMAVRRPFEELLWHLGIPRMVEDGLIAEIFEFNVCRVHDRRDCRFALLAPEVLRTSSISEFAACAPSYKIMRDQAAPFASRTHISINSYPNRLSRLSPHVDGIKIDAGIAVVTIAVSMASALN